MSGHTQKSQRGEEPGLISPPLCKGRSFVLLVLILILAAFLRLYRLEEVPPGLYSEEVGNGLDAQQVLGGQFSLFFEAHTGRQPLFIYLQALSLALWGNSPYALRVPAALIGIASVISIFVVARPFAPAGLGRNLFGLAAATIMGSVFWHVIFSRQGFRPILLPLFEIWLFYFFWRGLQERRLWFLTAAGLCLGASLYTYTAAYLLPLLFLSFLLYLFWAEGQAARWLLKPLSLMGLVAASVALPLGIYFSQRPTQLLGGPLSVAVTNPEFSQGTLLGTLAYNAVRALGMFWIAGDRNWRHNVSGWPTLDPVTGFLFALGLLVCLGSLRQKERGFLLLGVLVMLTPTIFASEGVPHARRILGTLPGVVLMAAYGWQGLWGFLVQRFAGLRRHASLSLLVLALAVAGPTFYQYFYVWGPHPRTAEAFEAEDLAGAQGLWSTLRSLPASQAPGLAFGPPGEGFQDLLRFLSQGTVASRPMDDGRYLVFPQRESRPVLYLPHSPDSPAGSALHASFADHALPTAVPLVRDVVGAAYLVPGQGLSHIPLPPGFRYLRRGLANGVILSGYALSDEVRAGEEVALTLLWQVPQSLAAAPAAEYRFFNHIIDEAGKAWGSLDEMGHSRSHWMGGEWVLLWLRIPLDKGIAPGRYWLELGMYELGSLRRVELLDAQGRSVGDRLLLGPIQATGTHSF